MTWVNAIMQPGSASSLFYIPTAIVLGALHGLEPGHSKTMMAAFIIAVRGTIAQAVLLGLAATISHTAVVWLVAFGGMYFFNGVNAEASEPYFQVVSAVLIIAIAVWMLTRTWREQQALKAEKASLAAAMAPTMRRIDTGHGHIGLELQPDDGVGAARFHVHMLSGHGWAPEDVGLTLTRPDGARENFTLAASENSPLSPSDGRLFSDAPVAAPHVFTVTLTLRHGDHGHDYDVAFTGAEQAVMEEEGDEPMDAHARAHANDIKRRFTDRRVTTGQIVMFGLTGGLIPCPAAITVLLLCLQVKQVAIGAVLVLSFSVGLALTMVSAGVIASISVHHLARRWSGGRLAGLASRAPYVSSAVIICMGIYLATMGLIGLREAGVI
jgi:nickel/cobalt exporter